jgi:two-component system, chemotaxis family, chemotaxis protein CheY
MRSAAVILVVDDEPSLVEAISSVLEDEGYSVATAPDGLAALRALHDGLRPCLAILDLMMPNMSGWELRAAMLADPTLAHIPVAICSAYARREVGALQAAAVLQKPFELKDILEIADRYCGAPS